MKHLAIDFAPRTPAVVVARVSFWMWNLLIAGLLVAAGAGWQLYSIRERVAALQLSLAQAQQRINVQSDKANRPLAASVAPAEAAIVNAAVRQLNIPWTDLLDAMEGAASKNVALLELRPEAASHRVVGLAEAHGGGDMITYVERLKAQSIFTNVIVRSHQINEQDRNKPVRFEFAATWQDFHS